MGESKEPEEALGMSFDELLASLPEDEAEHIVEFVEERAMQIVSELKQQVDLEWARNFILNMYAKGDLVFKKIIIGEMRYITIVVKDPITGTFPNPPTDGLKGTWEEYERERKRDV